MLLLLLIGCSQDVVVQGRVFDGWAPRAHPLPEATITLLDDRGAFYDSVVADNIGRFDGLAAPPSRLVYALTERQGYVRTAVPGSTPARGSVPVDAAVQDGDTPILYAVRDDVVDDLRARFSGCPGSDDGALGLVAGEMQAYFIDTADEGPTVTTGYAEVETADGDITEGCYLSADTLRYDPDASRTGETGTYAIFVPEGRYVLRVAYDLLDAKVAEAVYPTWVPEGGVAVRFPTWIEFALDPQ